MPNAFQPTILDSVDRFLIRSLTLAVLTVVYEAQVLVEIDESWEAGVLTVGGTSRQLYRQQRRIWDLEIAQTELVLGFLGWVLTARGRIWTSVIFDFWS